MKCFPAITIKIFRFRKYIVKDKFQKIYRKKNKLEYPSKIL